MAYVFAPKEKRIKFFLILSSTIIVDIDHLWATPIFDSNRCSINFHPLHSSAAIIIYIMCLALPKLRLISIGLLIHMALDYIDCCFMNCS